MKPNILISVFFALALLFVAPQVKAQEATLVPLIAGDSLSLSGSADTTTKTLSVTAGYSSFAIQVNLTKLSGTIAANSAKVYVYRSLDAVNYVLTDSSAAFTDQTTNVAQFSYTPAPFTRYRVQIRPMGGVTATYAAIPRFWYVAKRYNTQ